MSWCGHRASLPAHLTQRIEALDRLSGEPCLIVVDPSETADQALARYMQQTGTQPRDRVSSSTPAFLDRRLAELVAMATRAVIDRLIQRIEAVAARQPKGRRVVLEEPLM
jgi:predicted ATPase